MLIRRLNLRFFDSLSPYVHILVFMQPPAASVASTSDLVKSLRLGALYKRSRAQGEHIVVGLLCVVRES